MSNDKVISFEDRAIVESCSALDELARLGAQKMLQAALGNEVAEYSERHASEKDESGRRLVARNGVMPRRTLVSGVGPLEIRQPGVNDRREWERFSSKILPPFLRRLPSVDNLIPVLYLKGVSTGDFSDALQANGLTTSRRRTSCG